ncbi:MAG: hypothetical protein ACOCVI_03650 [Planctomycetota bacterium]
MQNLTIAESVPSISEDVYRTAITQYLQRVGGNPHLLAVYQMGSISHPGVSDMDLIVVTDDAIDPLKLSELSVFRGMTAEIKQVFAHDVCLFNRSAFKDVRRIIYVDNLTLLHGDAQPVDDLSDEEDRILALQVLFDFSASRLAQFKAMLSAGQIDTRGVLLRVASIKHSAKLLARLGISDSSLDAFVEKVLDIRARVRATSPTDIGNLFVESLGQFTRVVVLASQVLENEFLGFYCPPSPATRLLLNGGQSMAFCSPEQISDARIHEPGTVWYPTAAFCHFAASARGDSFAARRANQQLAWGGDEQFDLDQRYFDGRHRRLAAISDHDAFLHHNRLTFAMKGHPGFVYSPHGIAPPSFQTSAEAHFAPAAANA